MNRELSVTLRQLKERERELREEIRKVEIAREVLRSLPGSADVSTSNPLTLDGAITAALESLGKAKSREIYDFVCRFNPDVKSHSLRSVLSVGKRTGKYVRDMASNWSLKTKDTNATSDGS